jgi:hypothetical protein
MALPATLTTRAHRKKALYQFIRAFRFYREDAKIEPKIAKFFNSCYDEGAGEWPQKGAKSAKTSLLFCDFCAFLRPIFDF